MVTEVGETERETDGSKATEVAVMTDVRETESETDRKACKVEGRGPNVGRGGEKESGEEEADDLLKVGTSRDE